MTDLKGRTVFIAGASRGIGAAIARACAAGGANVAVAAKTSDPHPKLAGTIHSVAAECEALGARALAVQMDQRDLGQVKAAMEGAAEAFGGIDALVVNASVQTFTRTPDTTEVGRLFLEARQRLPGRAVLLGCARPAGLHRRVTDAYAVMAGLDGIAFPAEGTLAVATAIGRRAVQEHACCSIRTGQSIRLHTRATLTA